jgi:pimeloyl-ACP methyl ester carboxylesterase
MSSRTQLLQFQNRSPLGRQLAVLTAIALAGAFGTAGAASAQSFEQLQTAKQPLVLDAWGSFFVGGQEVVQTAVELGLTGTGSTVPGHVEKNQMYVQYMVPKASKKKIPLVLVHGGGLSGKGWETQPDGRMGWAEYFMRQGYPIYIPDQVGRARSGFDQKFYNNVRASVTAPITQPSIFQSSNENAWAVFRFGPSYGVPYADEQFPVGSINEFAKQVIPDLSGTVPNPNPTYQALADLAVKLDGAVIVGHSQSGAFPLEAALVNSAGTKGLVAIEPVGCNYNDAQVAKLTGVPILVMFGDHLDTPSFLNWTQIFAGCKAFVQRVNDAGGNATLLWPPDLGIKGNSHMMMNDKNSDQIADLILGWIDQNVAGKSNNGNGNGNNGKGNGK